MRTGRPCSPQTLLRRVRHVTPAEQYFGQAVAVPATGQPLHKCEELGACTVCCI